MNGAKHDFWLHHVICQSACYNMACTVWIVTKIYTGGFLLKCVEKIKVWINVDKNIRHITGIPEYIHDILG
jgi:hypothetical protein